MIHDSSWETGGEHRDQSSFGGRGKRVSSGSTPSPPDQQASERGCSGGGPRRRPRGEGRDRRGSPLPTSLGGSGPDSDQGQGMTGPDSDRRRICSRKRQRRSGGEGPGGEGGDRRCSPLPTSLRGSGPASDQGQSLTGPDSDRRRIGSRKRQRRSGPRRPRDARAPAR